MADRKLGVTLEASIERARADCLPADVLRERGLEQFIYQLSGDLSDSRREQLLHFLEACRPVPRSIDTLEWDVRIALMDDLRHAGRIASTIESSRACINVCDEVVSDIDLHLIDLSGGYIFSNQTALVPHAFLIVEHIRHMHPEWLEEGCLNYRLGPNNIVDINPRHRTGRLLLTGSPIKLPDVGVYFLFHGFVGTTSFGHFLIEILGQLIFYDRLKAEYGDKLIPVIASPHWFVFKWPGMKWLFEILIGPEVNILHLEGDCRAKISRGFTTTRVETGALGLSIKPVRYARDRIAEAVPKPAHPSTDKLIYVSRKDAGDREVNNIDGVEALLADRGFKAVLIEHLTPEDAYNTLSNADVIVGMHGSGLMYHFYAKPGTTIIEISHPVTMWTIIMSTAVALGHRAIRIRNVDGDADLEQLAEALETAVRPRSKLGG